MTIKESKQRYEYFNNCLKSVLGSRKKLELERIE